MFRCEWRSVYWFHQYNRHYSLHMKTCSPRLKSGVGLGPRILSLRVYDRESFTSFHLQAVMPVILVKPIDTSPLASMNISPLTNIPTSLST